MSTAPARQIEYLSEVTPVNMGDYWFDVANLAHFWIRRRFQVLRKLTSKRFWNDVAVAEVGCGSGLIQRQVEDCFRINVDGFDLNEHALRQNVAVSSRVCCYNIFDRLPELRQRYDVILLCDVLEHIEDTTSFLEALSFHLKDGGRVIINVPAEQGLYSNYDRAAGHVRRYSSAELIKVLEAARFTPEKWTYWGLPMMPLLHLRKYLLRNLMDNDAILHSGFKPPSSLGNTLLWWLSQLEFIPQQWKGSSLMLIATFDSGVGSDAVQLKDSRGII